MLKKLRFKFIVYTMSIFSLIVAVVIGGLYYQDFQQMDQRADEMLLITLNRSREFSFKEYNPLKPDNEGMKHTVWSFKITSDGVVVGSQYQIPSTSFASDIKALATANTGYVDYENHRFKYLIQNGETVFVDVTEDANRLSEVFVTSLVIGAIALVGVLLSSLMLSRWAMKPVEEAWKKQKEFVSDASHELRTPLSVILANTELLLDQPNTTIAQNEKQVSYIQDEAKRMKELVERLLFLAKNDKSQTMISKMPIDLTNTIYELVLPMEVIAFEKNRFFDMEIADNVMISADLAMIKQLLVILVDNAIKYSKENSKIIIRLTNNGILSVTNFGEVIPEEKLQRLFERFYRVDSSRNKDTDGYGLGLSIADTIVKAHHSKINVTSHKEKGTQFSVDFSKLVIKE